ncbi:MAG: QueT transporter family protein [Lachnospiraceae bacterium]|nr:QueT transporter family protein [Lachnospiraceae bacterium]
MHNSRKTLYLAQAGVIAAVYVVLTMIAAGFDLASGAIQVRFSEALTVLPFFTPAAVPGLIVGCLLANILTGCALPDIVFGTLATAIGAFGSYALRKQRFLVPLPPVAANAIIIPFVLRYAYQIPGSIPFFMATVGAGEVIACYVFGLILLHALMPLKSQIFAAKEC